MPQPDVGPAGSGDIEAKWKQAQERAASLAEALKLLETRLTAVLIPDGVPPVGSIRTDAVQPTSPFLAALTVHEMKLSALRDWVQCLAARIQL